MKSNKKAYTIFLEPSTGDWAWVKDVDDETMYVGQSVTWRYDWRGAHYVSKDLLDSVKFWSGSFAPVAANDENIARFDWQTFNESGLVIAQKLKAELGNKAEIRFVNACEDPAFNREEGFEIASNGTVLSIRRLWWTPV